MEIATDDFNRGSLGANWEQLNTFAGSIQITSNAATATAGSTGNSPAARWIGAGTFNDDQYSESQVTGFSFISADYFAGVIVRASGDTDGSRDHYFARVSADAGGPNYTTAFGKIVNGTVTTFHSASISWANNDFIGLEAEGTTIRVTKNGTALGGSFTTTDSSLTTGKPGVYIANSIMRVDYWRSGNIGGSDVTVELTGQSITASQGSVAPSSARALTGQSSSASAGTLIPERSFVASGQSVSASAGTIAANALSYIVIVGTPDPTSAYRITATPDISSGDWIQYRGVGGGAPPTGLVILPDATWYFTVGNYPADFDVRVSDDGGATWGSWATQSIGVWVDLTGQSASVSQGSVLGAISVALSGLGMAISQGTITTTGDVTLSLSGLSASSSSGSLAASVGLNLSGSALATASGTLAYSSALSLVGSLLSTAQGFITTEGNVTVGLTGAAMSAAAGTLSPAAQVALAGAAATTAAGTLTAAHISAITGQSLMSAAGILTAVRALALLGIPFTISQGTVTAQEGQNVTVYLTGLAMSLISGGLLPELTAALAGQPVSILQGEVGAVIPPTGGSPVPAPSPVGTFASPNPWQSKVIDGAPAGIAGQNGCVMGRFAWIAEDGTVTNARLSATDRLAFVLSQSSGYGAVYWSDGRAVLHSGCPVTLMASGDFWAQFEYGAVQGARVYADKLTGKPRSGYSPGSEATPWLVVTNTAPGALAIISTTSRVQ